MRIAEYPNLASWAGTERIILEDAVSDDYSALISTLVYKGGDGLFHFGASTLGTAASAALDTDTSLAANSDTKVASQKAVKAYVDGKVTGLLEFKGSTDCSANPNYPAAEKGDSYVVSVAGKIGGASGVSVDVGDVYLAKADNAGGSQASVGTSWTVLEHNLVGALLSAIGIAGMAGESASLGVAAYLQYLALVSLSLGILNLLPVPVLDGGHLLYHSAELVRGRPLPASWQSIGQRIGVALLVGLMLLALYNDIHRFIPGQG